MTGIAAEFENVALREAEVFQDLPRRVLSTLRALATDFYRQALDGVIEFDVRAAALEQI